LTKSGAVKAQIGVFGRFESIGDVFIGIWRLIMKVFNHSSLRKLQGPLKPSLFEALLYEIAIF
jgi:hypothetical protein